MGQKKKRQNQRKKTSGVSRRVAMQLWKDLGPMYAAFLVCYPVAYLLPVMLDSRFHERRSEAVWSVSLGSLLSLAVYCFFHVELSRRSNDSDGVVRDLFVNGLLSRSKVTRIGVIAGLIAGAMPSVTGYLAIMLGTAQAIDTNMDRLVLGPYCALLTMVAVLSYEVLVDMRMRITHRRRFNKLNLC